MIEPTHVRPPVRADAARPSRPRRARPACALALLLLVVPLASASGCSLFSSVEPAVDHDDAAQGADATIPDASITDVASPTQPDAGLPDGGPLVPETGVPDAGVDLTDVTLPSPQTTQGRSRDGLIALYTFEEGQGTQVEDRSGFGAPVDLAFFTTGVTWLTSRNGVRLSEGGGLFSAALPIKIHDAIQRNEAFTVEVWCRPEDLEQLGPARIVSLSRSTGQRNFTLGQGGADVHVRLRTSEGPLSTEYASDNGQPAVVGIDGLALREIHLVVVYDGVRLRIYRDGARNASAIRPGGLGVWDPTMSLVVGNEATGDRPWRGEMYYVAIYERALTEAEILAHFVRGSTPDP